MALCIDLNDLKCEFQVEEPRAALAHDFLPRHGRTWRIHVVDAHIEDMSPPVGGYGQGPNDFDGCIDDSRWTARIRHRNFASLSTTRNRSSVEARRSLFRRNAVRRGLA